MAKESPDPNDEEESAVLRSKFSTIESSQDKGHYSKYNFKAFTERGLYMLVTILKSSRATQTTLAIIDTFVEVREMARKRPKVVLGNP